MAHYLSNKSHDCQYWDRPSNYLFVSWAKEALIMDCILACAAEGKAADTDFFMAPIDQVLCGARGGTTHWVTRFYEQFKCSCIGCIGDAPGDGNTG